MTSPGQHINTSGVSPRRSWYSFIQLHRLEQIGYSVVLKSAIQWSDWDSGVKSRNGNHATTTQPNETRKGAVNIFVGRFERKNVL